MSDSEEEQVLSYPGDAPEPEPKVPSFCESFPSGISDTPFQDIDVEPEVVRLKEPVTPVRLQQPAETEKSKLNSGTPDIKLPMAKPKMACKRQLPEAVEVPGSSSHEPMPHLTKFMRTSGLLTNAVRRTQGDVRAAGPPLIKTADFSDIDWWTIPLESAMRHVGVLDRLQNNVPTDTFTFEKTCAGTSPVHTGFKARWPNCHELSFCFPTF